MTKKPFVSLLRMIPLMLLLCFILTGCGCKHDWKKATCTDPKTCIECGETEGEALGHSWEDATCKTPKTCSECGKTKGSPLDHTWVDATCETPKTCSVCGETEGDVLDHAWLDATTEAPKTCSACGKTEGEKIITDSRFTTSACKDLFGTWTGVVEVDGSTLVDANFTGTLKLNYTLTFHNDGTYQESIKMADVEQFNQSVTDYYVDALYKEFANMGLDQSQADAAMVETYGMDTRAYAAKLAAAYNWEELTSNELTGVYYVANGKLYSGTGWDAVLQSDSYAISDNNLSIGTLMQTFPGLTLSKI